VVLIDRVQIELVLRNLVSNAVEAVKGLPADERAITMSAGTPQTQFVRLSICDSGPGLEPGDRDRVFEPFVSGKPTGLGLGLAVSRAIAEAHGGSLSAQSAGRGEFILTLPVAGEHE
jgi:signal transduction histidine kinase